MVVGEAAWNIAPKPIHDHTRQTLSLSHWTVFVCKEEAFEADYFFPELGDLTRKCIVFG